MDNKWKIYENKKQMYIMSGIIIIITLLIMIGSLFIYLYVTGYFDNEEDPNGITITTTKNIEKKTKKTTTTSNQVIIKPKSTETTTVALKYEIAEGPSSMKNALWDWETAVGNLVNEYREKHGMNSLKVSVELRDAAENIANNDLINDNFTTNKFITLEDKNIGYSTGYKELYKYVIDTIRFKEIKKKIEWMGIGVIYKNNTHYFCFIYE